MSAVIITDRDDSTANQVCRRIAERTVSDAFYYSIFDKSKIQKATPDAAPRVKAHNANLFSCAYVA